jgi:E3 ubiquitin-protein ligase mind-bomb
VETDRSVASVTWVKTGVTNVYRVGHKGKVDIRCVKAVSWGQCYVDHLPILGLYLVLVLNLENETFV